MKKKNKPHVPVSSKEEAQKIKDIADHLPEEIIDPVSGKTFKKGEDFSVEAETQALCTHQKLEKLGFSFYICPECEVLLQVPFSLQYDRLQLLTHIDGLVKNLNTYFKDEEIKDELPSTTEPKEA